MLPSTYDEVENNVGAVIYEFVKIDGLLEFENEKLVENNCIQIFNSLQTMLFIKQKVNTSMDMVKTTRNRLESDRLNRQLRMSDIQRDLHEKEKIVREQGQVLDELQMELSFRENTLKSAKESLSREQKKLRDAQNNSDKQKTRQNLLSVASIASGGVGMVGGVVAIAGVFFPPLLVPGFTMMMTGGSGQSGGAIALIVNSLSETSREKMDCLETNVEDADRKHKKAIQKVKEVERKIATQTEEIRTMKEELDKISKNERVLKAQQIKMDIYWRLLVNINQMLDKVLPEVENVVWKLNRYKKFPQLVQRHGMASVNDVIAALGMVWKELIASSAMQLRRLHLVLRAPLEENSLQNL